MCYVLGILGGICGDCLSDADCGGGGCTQPNPLAQPPTGSTCNDGSYGDQCMSDAVCQRDLQCVEALNVPGVLVVSACSECATDADCGGGMLCAPDIAIAGLTGSWRCVAPMSLANGQSCDFEGSGDLSCQSGQCAVADVMGLLQIGVCSQCDEDGDCPMGQFCAAPEVDLNANVLIPGQCVM
jgi:Cys-rich repeat protein